MLPNLGDTIECDLFSWEFTPCQPKRLEAVLATQESLAFGRELVASGRWRLKRKDSETKEASNG